MESTGRLRLKGGHWLHIASKNIEKLPQPEKRKETEKPTALDRLSEKAHAPCELNTSV
jgi:hypothetical protein